MIKTGPLSKSDPTPYAVLYSTMASFHIQYLMCVVGLCFLHHLPLPLVT